jgi:type I restriction enzyme S subunit
MVYNAELKREIPAGWEVKELGEITTVILGGTPSTEIPEYWKAGNFNWLNSGEIANFPITSSELNITESAIKNSATSLMPSGTIVISITRHIRASILAINSCANQSVVGVYETEYLKSSYLYPLILNEIPRYLSLRTGAQQPHINKNTICNTRLIIPNSNDLAEYYKITAPLYKKIINNSFENQHLSSLRDWLLPMLMNGQVTVQGAYESQKEVDGEDMSMAAEEGADYQ